MKVTGHIYCLKDPTDNNRVFYIGQTVMNLNVRAVNHVTESRFRMTAKGLVITKILEAGMRPVIESLERFDADSYSDIDALMNDRELYWTQQFKGLCNKNYAGLDLICGNCGNPFRAKRSRAKFCSDVCRATFHQKKTKKEQNAPKEVALTESQEIMAMYKAIMEKIEKLSLQPICTPVIEQKAAFNGFIPSVEEKPRLSLKRTPAHWVELRRDCQNADDYAKWLEDLENDTFLTTREKSQIKQTV